MVGFEVGLKNRLGNRAVCKPEARTPKRDLAKSTAHISLPVVDSSEELEFMLLDGLVVNVNVVDNELLTCEHFSRRLSHSHTFRAFDDESVDLVDVLLHGWNTDELFVTAVTNGIAGGGSQRLRDRCQSGFRFFRRFGFWHC